MNKSEETAVLQRRVLELEKQLDNLRLSRRVLMNLLEQVEKEKNDLTQALERQNRKNHLSLTLK